MRVLVGALTGAAEAPYHPAWARAVGEVQRARGGDFEVSVVAIDGENGVRKALVEGGVRGSVTPLGAITSPEPPGADGRVQLQAAGNWLAERVYKSRRFTHLLWWDPSVTAIPGCVESALGRWAEWEKEHTSVLMGVTGVPDEVYNFMPVQLKADEPVVTSTFVQFEEKGRVRSRRFNPHDRAQKKRYDDMARCQNADSCPRFLKDPRHTPCNGVDHHCKSYAPKVRLQDSVAWGAAVPRVTVNKEGGEEFHLPSLRCNLVDLSAAPRGEGGLSAVGRFNAKEPLSGIVAPSSGETLNAGGEGIRPPITKEASLDEAGSRRRVQDTWVSSAERLVRVHGGHLRFTLVPAPLLRNYPFRYKAWVRDLPDKWFFLDLAKARQEVCCDPLLAMEETRREEGTK